MEQTRRVRFWGAWPPTPGEGRRRIALTSYLFDPSDPREPGFNPRGWGYPDLIEEFADLLSRICRVAIRDGYSLRIDFPKECAELGLERVVRSSTESGVQKAIAAMKSCLVNRLSNERYSVALWLIPDEKGEEAVDLFKKLPFDESIAEEVFSAGVVRLSLGYSTCDFMAGYDFADLLLRWLGDACQQYGAERVSWAVGIVEHF